ncbi:MAG: caspase family protein [Myxococcales bacterium]|nr:caspase family protein [Myxococcales bacterium]
MKRHAWAAVVGLVLLLTRAHAARVTEPTPPQPRAVFALLIGYSEGPPGLGLPALTRAESDVVMMNAFFGTLGPEAVYVHIESAATRSALAVPGRVHVGPATFPAIMASVRAIEQALEDAGPADVYVYYAGHGQRVRVDERAQTELFLRPVGAGAGNDGVLRSTLLQSEILVPLSADEDTRVHLVVDACQSYFVLEARKGLRQVARRAGAAADRGGHDRALPRSLRAGGGAARDEWEPGDVRGSGDRRVVQLCGAERGDRVGGSGSGRAGDLRGAGAGVAVDPGAADGGPPGLVAPDNDPETAFVDYRGRGWRRWSSPAGADALRADPMPSHQKYAVLYPGRAPVRAWLPRGAGVRDGSAAVADGAGEWFEFMAASANFEALRQPRVALDGGAGEVFARRSCRGRCRMRWMRWWRWSRRRGCGSRRLMWRSG